MGYCDEPIGDGWNDTLRTYFCGVREAFTGPASDVVTGAQDTVGGVFTGAQDTLGGFGQDAVDVALGAQDTIGGAVEDVTEAANPLNLLGLGTGVGLGAVAAAVGVGLVGALAADQLLAGGQGTAALVRRVTGRRR